MARRLSINIIYVDQALLNNNLFILKLLKEYKTLTFKSKIKYFCAGSQDFRDLVFLQKEIENYRIMSQKYDLL